ncbi:uncharacterized protein LOC113062007 isoform X2 [Carassius auratus]|uniref:Uncharacterized protein LOC113062007 isoform X1 n=1 Tax=Carassius auratus TaxID=7957 RepID=A0A6P6LV28_CARAU|nr:uncharacterized protein LOC113062007 isoform X1 [Carassius auratus]XP_026087291.1 uncharacterized protein LOC113062007 isoform X2 [Carassius auratus]
MGCCFSSPDRDVEREPLLQSSNRTQTESARPPRPAAKADGVQKSGRFTARHVGVPGLDERFTDVADTFNKQQDHYETMKNNLQTLASHYHCQNDDSLSQCLKKIKEKHELCHISLEVKGYDFILMVKSDTEIPGELKQTQENITEMSRATKAIISVGTKLTQMIDSLLRAEDGMISQVEAAESRHQGRRRLVENLRENLRETRRVKELSPKYRKEAENLLNEAARLSGITP